MEIGRRSLLKGALASAAGALLGRTGFAIGKEERKVKPPPAKPAQPPLLDSCFVNLNQPQRYANTHVADMEGRRRFPMIDTRQIREIEGCELRFHQAEKHGDPVMTADPRLERGTCIYGTVHHDGEHFRMWYQPIPLVAQGAGNPYDVAYAESADGIHWERPNLGLVERGGSKKNNLVTFRGHGPSVIDLGTAAPPERRYLGIAVGYAPILGVPEVLRHEQTKRHHGYWIYYSADGLNWKVYPPPTCAILNYMSDTACFIGDPYRNRVLGSVKLEPRVRLFDRRSVTITAARMDNVADWGPCRLAVYPDEMDDRMAKDRGCRFAEFYGMGLLAQRDVLIGFPEVYWVEGKLHPSQAPGVRLGFHGKCEIQMAYSYDGYAWHRTIGRRPFIPLGKEGEWDDGFLTAQSSAVEVGDAVFIYYSGNRGGHSAAAETNTRKVGLAKVRKDRFASIAADGEGMVEVYHGKPEGRELVVNARAAADGVVRVEAREASGKVIPGFAAGDCGPIAGDGVRLAAGWGNKSWTDLPKSANIVLRFHLKKAEVFAYEIEV